MERGAVPAANVRLIAEERGLMTTRQVARASGVTYRQMDYYARHGILTPAVAAAGSGSARLWDPAVLPQIEDLLRRVAQCPFCSHDQNRGGRG